MEEDYKPFYKEEGIAVIQAIIDNIFEEALGFRVSSEYGGGHDTAEEPLHLHTLYSTPNMNLSS
jgi:hypothetical protein